MRERNETMRMKLYQFMVNRHTGIKTRYHAVHDGAAGIRKLISYGYLLWLNFCYYVLFCRFLDKKTEMDFSEKKRLPTEKSESKARILPKELAKILSRYDMISFDLFDTLIFRPFSEPADLFYFLGERLGIPDLKRIRMEQEFFARKTCQKEKGHMEITLAEIWLRIEKEVGIPKDQGMETECALEKKFCYANPYMKEVFHHLKNMGKRIVLISDMYLPESFLRELAEACGYTGFEKLYISCDYGKSKADGGLYGLCREDYPGKSFIHIGDNRLSDVKMAEKNGFMAYYYPNINLEGKPYRSFDLSPVIGSAYRGIVNSYLYNGLHGYSMEYEYGFIYGGLFVLGYCHFIHEYCRKNEINRLLFLSRDGDILKQAYDLIFPGEDTVYAYWSRAAAVKLMAEYDRYDYFRRYVYHKVNQGITVSQALSAMELDFLAEEWKELERELTDKNADKLKLFLQEHFNEIIIAYRSQRKAAQKYYAKILAEAKRAAVIDIGWAGSGALSLSYLTKRIWKLPCELTGILAGTNTPHNAEWDASEMFLQTGKLVSYLYSASHNRDLWKKHDPGKNYNVYWELLLSSHDRQFLGFRSAEEMSAGDVIWERDQSVAFHFGRLDPNQKGICEIQQGILDFVKEYMVHFKDEPCMLRISGRDAYAPMLLAAGHQEKYLKKISEKFQIEIGI